MHVDRRARFDTFFPGHAEDFLRLLSAWSIPFTLLDADEAVVFWNRGAVKFYGVSEDEALGKRFRDLVAEAPVGTLPPVVGERTRRYEAHHRSALGADLPVMVTRTDLPAADGNDGAFVLVTDLTESKALERRLARRVAQLSTLREIGECLQSAMSPERILRTILVGATASVGLRFNRAFLLLVDERHNLLRGREAIGPADADEAQRVWSRLAAAGSTLRDLVDDFDPIVDSAESAVLQIARQLSAKLDDESAFVVSALNANATTRVRPRRGSSTFWESTRSSRSR
jgi:PAS domain S-box-containing protein